MSRETGNHSESRSSEPREKGLVGSALGFLFGLLSAALFALFVSVCIEWGGIMSGLWGQDHAGLMLATERAYIEAIEDYPLTPLLPVEASDLLGREVDKGLTWLGVNPYAGSYLAAAINTIKLVILRTTLTLFSLPGYFLISLVAFFEGLVARDIRKFTGEHESSYVFHKVKRLIVPSLILTITIYLILPFSLPPAVVFLPTMILVGVMVYIAVSRFKKFV